MSIRCWLPVALVSVSLLAHGGIGRLMAAEVGAPAALDACNVVFTTPSSDDAGAVHLGNGEVGASVWIEPDGDLLFYLARNDSFSEMSRLMKVGKLRVHLEPSPLAGGAPFRQELKLRQGRLEADLGKTHLELFADPDRPVLRLTIRSPTPAMVRVSDEGWRRKPRVITGEELSACWTVKGLPESFVVQEGADVSVPAARAPAALAWYHHNPTSVVPQLLKQQDSEGIPGYQDPLTHRTFGAWVEGTGLVRLDDLTLRSAAPMTEVDLRIACPTCIDPEVGTWIAGAEAAARAGPPAAEVRARTEAWWSAFWNRSWILVDEATPPAKPSGVERISAGYNLSRWMLACQGRGQAPIKFNGGMFTVEPRPAPAKDGKPAERLNADYRRWGDPFWWQNTRHMYHPMLPAGDRDLMDPLFDLYRRAMPVGEARVARWWQAQGTYFPETMTVAGTYSFSEYGYDRSKRKPGDIASPWWRYAWNQGPELVALMLDTWDWTLDERFAREQLVPMAASVVRYFDTRFKKDGQGLLVLDPCQAIEMYREATNDQPTIAGLRAILPRLLALPAGLLPDADCHLHDRMWKACPPLPTEERPVEGRPTKVLSPAAQYVKKRQNNENPEIYAIWPFRLFGVGKPELAFARDSFNTRFCKSYRGWGYDGQAAALLGLTDEAAQAMILKCANSNNKYRFPATWGPNFDWLPDQNHAGNLMNTAQVMLLQYNGSTITLLPAWPSAWNCRFKLHAPANTVVEGEVAGGKLIRLEVTPAARRQDVVVCPPFTMP